VLLELTINVKMRFYLVRRKDPVHLYLKILLLFFKTVPETFMVL